MIASILPDSVIEWGTDIVFIAALIAALLYVGKRAWGFMKEAREAVDDDETE
jgi:hypothetical protein